MVKFRQDFAKVGKAVKKASQIPGEFVSDMKKLATLPFRRAFKGYKKGGKVKKTGPAYLHKGERVLTKKQAKSFKHKGKRIYG